MLFVLPPERCSGPPLHASQAKEERKANYHRQRAFVLSRQQRELAAQQEELWAAMEPEAAAAYRARKEEERAAAEAATRRQFFQVGAALKPGRGWAARLQVC